MNLQLKPLSNPLFSLQIAQGLEFLHGNQVVHLDMKSPNVLLWHFPSPHLSRPERVQQASKVWLKIADYGISQSGLSLRVDNSPVGTPGFMAPELFEKAGQVVSSEKVRMYVQYAGAPAVSRTWRVGVRKLQGLLECCFFPSYYP